MPLANATLLRPANENVDFEHRPRWRAPWETHEERGVYALRCLVCITLRLIGRWLPVHERQ